MPQNRGGEGLLRAVPWRCVRGARTPPSALPNSQVRISAKSDIAPGASQGKGPGPAGVPSAMPPAQVSRCLFHQE